MSKQNPIAKELRTPKYKMRVNKNKKKYTRKKKPFNDPFKELVDAMNNKAKFDGNAGQGVVKTRDVERMADVLNEQGSKDA
tara:strand:- start:617 stop:859 length:243 start_codon:yes stop_codon:yes gene_type:complete